MDRLIYTALTGLQRAEERQQVTAHNLANAVTPGFRREMANLSAGWLAQGGAALTSRVQSGGEAPHDLLNAGRVETTGNRLDVALDGGAWLAVGDATGAEALTRRGDLRLTSDGQLINGDGHPVMADKGGPIRIATGFAALRIAPNGELQTRATEDSPFVAVARMKLVSPDPATLSRGEDGLFRAPVQAADPLATVTDGALERSNVESTTALVELIEQSRAFDMQTKLVSAARDLDEATAALMRVE